MSWRARIWVHDFWFVNDAPDLYLRTKSDKATWRDAVEYIAAQDIEVAARAAYYEESLSYHDGRSGPVRCLGLIDQYGVTYEGDLLPCCVWGGDGLVVGNVFDTPLRELWASEVVQAHREGMFDDGCSAGCYNHSLYEFEVATGESFRVGENEVGSGGVQRQRRCGRLYPEGNLVVESGRVPIRYSDKAGTKIYRAGQGNLRRVPGEIVDLPEGVSADASPAKTTRCIRLWFRRKTHAGSSRCSQTIG